MIHFTAPDGTRLTAHRGGSGPPLVLVHGSGAANPTAWSEVVARLEERFTVYALDRRGHRQSSDAPGYQIEREFEDIAAIVDSMSEPAGLLGHSFGALVALEAARLSRNLYRLILYEPGMNLPDRPLYPPGFVDRLQARLEAGDREGVLTAVYMEIGNISAEEMARFRSSPTWPARVAAAHNIVREARAEEAYRFEPRRFTDVHVPTLLLVGSESPVKFKAISAAAAAALPESRVAVLPGQQHIAMYTAPGEFLRAVVGFLMG